MKAVIDRMNASRQNEARCFNENSPRPPVPGKKIYLNKKVEKNYLLMHTKKNIETDDIVHFLYKCDCSLNSKLMFFKNEILEYKG